MNLREQIERLAGIQGVYQCPKHGQVWRYAGPEPFDCVYCLNEAEDTRS